MVEVRIEHGHLRDPVHREVVPCRRRSDCFGSRRVVQTERLLLVLAHIRVEPRHAFVGVPRHEGEAQLRTLRFGGDVKAVREQSFYDIARHFATSQWLLEPSFDRTGSAAKANEPNYSACAGAATQLWRSARDARPRPRPERGCERSACAGSRRRDCRRSARRARAAARSLSSGTRRHELQYLQLPGREIRGIQPGGRSWTTGQAASPAPPETSRDDRRCGLGPELLQLLERRPQRRLLVGVRERKRPLVRAIQLAPSRRGPPPIARELQGVRRGSSVGVARGETLTTPPVSELSDQPRRPTIMRQFEGAVSLVSRLAEQPRDLGAGCRHRTEPSDLPRRRCQRPCFVEQIEVTRIPASRSHEREDDECVDAR